jgi:hypothetical protein
MHGIGMRNPLIRLINEGKINSLQQLKKTYRILVMKTHPDAVGSTRLVEGYLSLSSYYEEARRVFENVNGLQKEAGKVIEKNHRLAYYQILQRLELIDKPYSFHRLQNSKKIKELKDEAYFHFITWNGRYEKLYKDADQDYDRLKSVMPLGPYMKHALAINVSPVFHNIITYHLTGMMFYRRQVNQNLKAILQKLVAEKCQALNEFIELLIRDMNNGPAVFGEGKRIFSRIDLDQKE